MEFDKKDNELIDKITDYFERKYGTAIVIVANDEDMTLSGRNFNHKEIVCLGNALISNALKEMLGDEEDTESNKFDEIMKAIGKED